MVYRNINSVVDSTDHGRVIICTFPWGCVVCWVGWWISVVGDRRGRAISLLPITHNTVTVAAVVAAITDCCLAIVRGYQRFL